MASYMPSFMSKHISTGAGAAYGQPFAFTTGIDGDDVPTEAKSKNPKKGKKKRKSKVPQQPGESKEMKDAKKKTHRQHNNRLTLRVDDMDTLTQINKTHMDAIWAAYKTSQNIDSLNSSLRAAMATALNAKTNIFEQYYRKSAEGVENAKMRNRRDEVAYWQSPPQHKDEREWKHAQFEEYKKIYLQFYSDRFSALNGHTGEDFKALMQDIVSQKQKDLKDFYAKYPDLTPKSRAK